VGTYQKNQNFGFVVADQKKIDKDLFIPKNADMGAITGHKVVAEIIDFGDAAKNPEGRIIEIIGHTNEPGTDIMAIVKSLGIPNVFPDPVVAALETVPTEILKNDAVGRLDLRKQLTVTIDGEDATDLDDAITLEKVETGYKLGVHIADVTHYVREGSPLDVEAVIRGTSVYLADRVIPMLPRKLSNGICSLNAGVDRLSLSCIMDIDYHGDVTNYEIAETVINVDYRMSYTDVKKILLDEDPAINATYEKAIPMFKDMENLAAILRKMRSKRGSIDFDFPEAKVILDEQGKPIEIKEYERNVATKIIEEFMLLANETVAEHFFWQQTPFVYRSHDDPSPEKLKRLSAFIYNFGYHIKTHGDIHPKQIQQLLNEIAGTHEELVISRLTLRSMQKAAYTTTNDGHYGLATEYYCHFTSPIRRYPDLQIHRIIKESLPNGLNEARTEHYQKILPNIAKLCSEYERRAEEAERETIKLKKVEYMMEHIGETFNGVISSVTSFGLFVELENTIEGLVHVTALDDDYYNYDEEHYCFIGERKGKIYRLGERIKVNVANADKQLRTIDFTVVKELIDK
ncbi:MAG: ribonuclease R, partial [Vallitaleaceae bacterium]|nr:ribonuclease R [Vallitaleaceae bacterium]